MLYVFWNTSLILIYSSSEWSEEEKSLKLSLIYLIPFFSMYLHSFKNTYRYYISSFLTAESKVITAKQVWLESTFGIFLSQKSVTSSPWDFILVFKNYLLQTGSLSNSFFISALTLSRIISSSIKKYINLVCPS